MNRRCLLVLALALAGCSSTARLLRQADLELKPPKPLAVTRMDVSLAVSKPKDARPAVEIVGAKPRHSGFYVFREDWRGPDVFVFGDPGTAALTMQLNLTAFLHGSKAFGAVVPDGDCDYRLETEIKHLVISRYREYSNGMWLYKRTFSGHGTVALGLTLFDRSGRQVASGVAVGRAVGPGRAEDHMPENANIAVARNFGILVSPEVHALRGAGERALRQALLRARNMVASWVRQDHMRSVSSEQADAVMESQHEKGHTFLLRWVSQDRSRVQVAVVACPSGKVLSRGTLPHLEPTGPTGVWVLATEDPHGLAYPTPLYEAWARHLAKHFVLERDGELTAYRFLGRRAEGEIPAE
jgi:hypothetical protein